MLTWRSSMIYYWMWIEKHVFYLPLIFFVSLRFWLLLYFTKLYAYQFIPMVCWLRFNCVINLLDYLAIQIMLTMLLISEWQRHPQRFVWSCLFVKIICAVITLWSEMNSQGDESWCICLFFFCVWIWWLGWSTGRLINSS